MHHFCRLTNVNKLNRSPFSESFVFIPQFVQTSWNISGGRDSITLHLPGGPSFTTPQLASSRSFYYLPGGSVAATLRKFAPLIAADFTTAPFIVNEANVARRSWYKSKGLDTVWAKTELSNWKIPNWFPSVFEALNPSHDVLQSDFFKKFHFY